MYQSDGRLSYLEETKQLAAVQKSLPQQEVEAACSEKGVTNATADWQFMPNVYRDGLGWLAERTAIYLTLYMTIIPFFIGGFCLSLVLLVLTGPERYFGK